LLGYCRVSTNDQDLSVQLDALRKAGVKTIFREKLSGASANRPALKKCLTALRRGDVLVVVKLDRLGRSLRDLVNMLHDLQERGVGFRSLNDPWCDTGSPTGKLMLAMIAALAEYERSLIVARTSEGRERAKANGVRFGRPKKMSAFQQAEALKRLRSGEAPSLIGRSYSVSAKTVLRLNGGAS
jgi:DNA invertase Pin-like site-specific DNA recombinase